MIKTSHLHARLTLAMKYSPVVYLSMPKAGCTSIKNLLYYADHGVYYSHPTDIHDDPKAIIRPFRLPREESEHYLNGRKFTFTFVRDPFARVYSLFNEKIQNIGPHSFPHIRRQLIEDYGADFTPKQDILTPVQHGQNFLAFLRLIEDSLQDDCPIASDAHWLPQSMLINICRIHFNVDFVGRLENFETGIRAVFDLAGIQRRPDFTIRYNEGPLAPFALTEVINAEIFAALDRLYATDVALFGYDNARAKLAV